MWIANYASKNVVIGNVNLQGTRIGVSSPFFYSQTADATREGSLTVENSYFRTYIGVSVATAYADEAKGGVAAEEGHRPQFGVRAAQRGRAEPVPAGVDFDELRDEAWRP